MNTPADSANPPLAEPDKRPSGANVGGKAAPAPTPAAADDDEDEWRHPPVAPVDERNPLRSLGKAVADTLTNSDPQTKHRPPER